MSRELLQQALELLEVADQPEGYVPDFHDTIKAIRAHLAAQPAPVPVPLTADDIWLLWTRACEKPQLTRDLVCDFVRAIEQAHGIAASPEVP